MSKTVQPIRSLLKIEQMKEILAENCERDRFLFVFGINSGLRISDILPLKVKDVKDKDYFRIKEEKTGKNRDVIILDDLKQEIKKYIEGKKPNEFLFANPRTKKAISTVQAWRILKGAAEKVGIPEIGTHSLRKTFGYHFYQRNRDLALIQRILNHASPSDTHRYIGLEQDEIMAGYEKFGGL